MSSHASRIHLPAHAVLTVRSALTTVVYRAADLRQSELWSRVQPGDSLEFKLSVPSAEREYAILEIQSFQAGHRALGDSAKDHPYYQQLQRLSAAAGNTACAQNYECNITAANAVIAGATVGIVISNVFNVPER